MTLLERATTEGLFQAPPSEFDESVRYALLGIPYGVGAVITGPDPDLQVILVHDAPDDAVELVEDTASRRLDRLRETFDRNIDLLVLSVGEAKGLKLTDARPLSLPR